MDQLRRQRAQSLPEDFSHCIGIPLLSAFAGMTG
jgi:hypothetical protein